MTRRLVLAILGTTVAALVLAGLGTLVIGRAQARKATESDLRQQANALVASLVQTSEQVRPNQQGLRPAVVNIVKRALHLDDAAILTFGPNGGTADTPPAGVTLDDLRVPDLLAGTTVSGSHGSLVYAAAPYQAPRSTVVAVLTRRVDAGFRNTWRWFLLSSLVVIALATVVSLTLARRLNRPLHDVQVAAGRIAAGDFAARVEVPHPDAPDEISDLQRSVNSMAESLQRSKLLEQQFLLSVSHDLRTPLTSIKGYAEAISDGATSDPRWAASVILTESKRLERLVRDLLDLGRLEARTFSLQHEAVDLSDVAAGAAEGFGPDAQAAGVTLQVQADGAVPVTGDPDRLAQVAANLLENALKYARSRVLVGAQAAAGTAMLWVDDDGPGIAAADLPHVFERLYVARHEPARKEVGSGLGLAIVRELVTAMGGTVAAEPAPGGGARLVVRLPLAAAASPAPSATPPSPPAH